MRSWPLTCPSPIHAAGGVEWAKIIGALVRNLALGREPLHGLSA